MIVLEPVIALTPGVGLAAFVVGFTLIELRAIRGQIRKDRRFGESLSNELVERVTKELGREPTREELARFRIEIGEFDFPDIKPADR